MHCLKVRLPNIYQIMQNILYFLIIISKYKMLSVCFSPHVVTYTNLVQVLKVNTRAIESL